MTLRAAEMGWSESRFWAASFVEYAWAWNGYYRRSERFSMEGARLIYAMLYNTNVPKKNQKTNLNRMLPLTIDLQKVRDEEYWKELRDNVPESWYDILNNN